MSLAHAIDPGARPGAEPCAAKGCPSPPRFTVRARLGSRHPSQIRVCPTHHQILADAGELEPDMPPPCAINSEHGPVAARGLCRGCYNAALRGGGLTPGKGVAPGEVLAWLQERAAKVAQVAAVAAEQTPPERTPPVVLSAVISAPETLGQLAHMSSVIAGQKWAASAVGAAMKGDDYDGDGAVGELRDQLKAVRTMGCLLRATRQTLDELGAPDGERRSDGSIDSTPATRVGLLIRYFQDAIRSALPGEVDGGGSDGSPLDFTLSEITQGLENAREEGRLEARHLLAADQQQEIAALRAQLAEPQEQHRHIEGSRSMLVAQVEATPDRPWQRYRVALCGHVVLGEVEARRTVAEGLELRDGSLIGPAAIFTATPVLEPPPLPEPVAGLVILWKGERRLVESVLGEGACARILFMGGRWCPRWEWARPIVEIAPEPPSGEDVPF